MNFLSGLFGGSPPATPAATAARITQLAAALVAAIEGFRAEAYWDAYGKVWTIGYGHTKGVKQGDTATEAVADLWLETDLAPLVELVKDRPLLEAAALASFGYNLGEAALQRYLAGEIVLRAGWFMVLGAHGTYVPYGEVSDGVRLPGLVARRRLESALIAAAKG